MPIDADAVVAAVRQAMPPNAEINLSPGVAHINIGVAWKLNNDPERPNKMSKTIVIQVTHEAAQDFESASTADKSRLHDRVARFLAAELANFDPQHDTPRFEPPPVETWRITSEVLLG